MQISYGTIPGYRSTVYRGTVIDIGREGRIVTRNRGGRLSTRGGRGRRGGKAAPRPALGAPVLASSVTVSSPLAVTPARYAKMRA